LNSSDSSSEPPDSTNAAKAPEKSGKQRTTWSLNEEGLNKLLHCFSPDPDEAAKRFLLARQRVLRVFEWNGIKSADDYVDETIDRTIRKIDEGHIIDNLLAYLIGVARVIVKELHKNINRVPVSLDDIPVEPRFEEQEVIEPEHREVCFDQCLKELTKDNHSLILEYYEGTGNEKIRRRQRLADKLGIPLNALRIRAHRVRKSLENCIAKCLEVSSARNN